jgi:hypothetical protein
MEDGKNEVKKEGRNVRGERRKSNILKHKAGWVQVIILCWRIMYD